MKPTASQVHVDQALTTFSLAYQNQLLVADDVAPVITVPNKSGKYYTFGVETRDAVSDLRAADGTYNRVQHALSTDTYSCDDRGLEEPIDDSTLANADEQVNPLEDATNLVTELVKLNTERRIAALVSGSAWSQSTAVAAADRWDGNDSDPLKQIQADRDALVAAGGMVPNRLLLGNAVWAQLKYHPILRKLFESTGTTPSAERLADYFEVEQVVIGRAVYNTSKQGKTSSMAAIWGKIAFLYYFPPAAPGLRTPTALAQFSWTKDTNGARQVIERYHDDRARSEIVRNRIHQDEKVCALAFAALRTTVIN